MMLASTSVERQLAATRACLGALAPDVVVADRQPLVGAAATLEAIPSAALLNLEIPCRRGAGVRGRDMPDCLIKRVCSPGLLAQVAPHPGPCP